MDFSSIIDQSLLIFNKYGYHDTSLELLLDQIQVRPSDFHRDFSGIDDLVEKAFFQLCKESDDMAAEIDMIEKTSLEKLFITTVKSYELQVKYRFIFLDMAHILGRHERIKDRYFELISLRKAQLSHLFVILKNEGIFRDEKVAGTYENLSSQMIMLSDYWPTHNYIIFGNEAYHYQYYGKLIFSMVLPFLTEKGLELYKTILGYK
ncbi:TetR/AcrR family transcriptional regulator [Negadavirga shengliensis]|uniref:TetR/AcrR family transcriptional regulator n=1 Tax=Negadavirga shengliensis TaxID=1389218 RepID=A0ABV9SVB1_9BACT